MTGGACCASRPADIVVVLIASAAVIAKMGGLGMTHLAYAVIHAIAIGK